MGPLSKANPGNHLHANLYLRVWKILPLFPSGPVFNTFPRVLMHNSNVIKLGNLLHFPLRRQQRNVR